MMFSATVFNPIPLSATISWFQLASGLLSNHLLSISVQHLSTSFGWFTFMTSSVAVWLSNNYSPISYQLVVTPASFLIIFFSFFRSGRPLNNIAWPITYIGYGNYMTTYLQQHSKCIMTHYKINNTKNELKRM